jgi:hypothetical protein
MKKEFFFGFLISKQTLEKVSSRSLVDYVGSPSAMPRRKGRQRDVKDDHIIIRWGRIEKNIKPIMS